MPANARLTPSDWATIVTLYERAEKNISELAEQFGVTKQAIQQGLKSRGVSKGSRLDEVSDEVDDAARKAREAQVAQANATRDNYAKWVDVLAKMTMKKLIDASQGGGVSTVNADILTIKNGMAIIEKARSESWVILGIEDLLGEGAELPDLNVGEYTEDELDKIREGNEASYLDNLVDEDDDSEADDPDADADD